MAAYRKIPATGNADLDRVNQAVFEALTAIAPPAGFQAVTVAKDYAARGDEGVIHVDASAGPVRVTLPAPSTTMAPLVVKQVNLSKNPRATFGQVTVVAAGAASTIAGANSFALDASGTGSVTFTSDGQQHWPGAAAGGNPSVTPTPPAPPPFVPPPSVTFVPLTRQINTVPPLFGGGALSADLTLSLQQSAVTLLGNPNATAGNTIEIPLGPGLGFVTFGGPFELANTSPLSDLSALAPLNLAGTVLSAPGVLYTGGGPGSIDLGLLASGVLEQTVSGAVSTPVIFSTSAGRLTFGAASGGGLADNANLVFNGSKLSLGQATFDGTAHVVLTDDTTPNTIAAWDGRHATFGVSGPTGAGFGISHTASTSTSNLSAVFPNVAWENLRVQALTFGLYSGGATLGLSQDVNGLVAANIALGVNGVTLPTNASLVVGHTTNANRDRVQFFLGGGVLGGGGTSDSTLFDVNPTGTTVVAGVTAGIYATQRIRSLTYTGASAPTITEAASLYVDGAPTLTSLAGTAYAMHVAGGNVRVNSLAGGPGLVKADANGVLGLQAGSPSYTQQWATVRSSSFGTLSILSNKQSVLSVANGLDQGFVVTAAGGTSVPTTIAANYTNFPMYFTSFGAGYAHADLEVNIINLVGSGSGSGSIVIELFSMATDPTVAGNYTSLGTVTQGFSAGGATVFVGLSTSLSAIPPGASLALAVYRSDSTSTLLVSNGIAFTATLIARNP